MKKFLSATIRGCLYNGLNNGRTALVGARGLIGFALCVQFLSACIGPASRQANDASPFAKELGSEKPGAGIRFSVMTYNVENLFDHQKDQGKDDYTFLPLSKKRGAEFLAYCNEQKGRRKQECLSLDWSESNIEKKMQNLAQVVLQVRGKGPDVLLLNEIENLSVLKTWNAKFLGPAGYVTQVLLEGDDPRGIDVALLSRFPVVGTPVLHRLPRSVTLSGGKKIEAEENFRTRGVLEVGLRLPDGTTAFFFVTHLPSPANPVEERKIGASSIRKWMAEKPKDALVIAGGDFNVTKAEDKREELFAEFFPAPEFQVSHVVGCRACVGTHYFRKDWSFLDALIFRIPSPSGWKLDTDSVVTPRWASNQLESSDQSPASFSLETGIGASDHLPIYAEIFKSN